MRAIPKMFIYEKTIAAGMYQSHGPPVNVSREDAGKGASSALLGSSRAILGVIREINEEFELKRFKRIHAARLYFDVLNKNNYRITFFLSFYLFYSMYL